MQVRAGWVVLGLAAVAGLAWYAARGPADPAADRARQARADQAAAEIAADAEPVLYRWRDANGVTQITEEPPKGRKYERIPRDAAPAIEVRGDRE
ncbi:DUF4124 domain-containing protein [Lysobacter sp. KIS68-7]|uniref:DUF4124 domain-containing protein n=1 Tax=Lysobacter sp. KIS68-7 TaxID=2904252 RepID=UPI001E5EED25|nr:DUF4124 domain-containing protein [Lysobacter sp. KIS68-7]UHQ19986.1 DUF4124 domain-containing protein [Lysobacter sp. KIS68-7]